MTRQAGTVIVGGGIWGLSVAFHLARAGRTDVLVLERNHRLFDETTSQAAGLVGQIRATPLMRRAVRYAIDLFVDFERETEHDPGFRQVGSLLLALTPERMASFGEHVEHADRNGVKAHFVDGAEMSRLAPHLDASRVEGGYLGPDAGQRGPRPTARARCRPAPPGAAPGRLARRGWVLRAGRRLPRSPAMRRGLPRRRRGTGREDPDGHRRDRALRTGRPGGGGGDGPRLRRGGAGRGDGWSLDGDPGQ